MTYYYNISTRHTGFLDFVHRTVFRTEYVSETGSISVLRRKSEKYLLSPTRQQQLISTTECCGLHGIRDERQSPETQCSSLYEGYKLQESNAWPE